ncbi:inositol-phosphate phosphatase [Fictibacillus macauensis ZFHKF-1]|uniref:inositol-phosphate phosphatase n=1 Tax=Fictibacillus macauensis ZFHKF-1 TaxID=1196324 RepID=I8UDE1_9BACL|nr:inositol monophosphatase family protein [Fictibacillus macauensis]EIT84940.1 inositol-phosphate phosphatase [Fictibacillus macauensis ZFHKF-1]
MNDAMIDALYKQAKEWVYEAGAMIKDSFSRKLDITYKSHQADLVTNMDKNIEKFFATLIHEHYPDHKIIGEEGYGDEVKKMDGTLWIIDPIDGTTNFVHQQSNFAISIGIFVDGVGVIAFIYDVARDELFHCVKGQGIYLNDQKLPSLRTNVLAESVVAINGTWLTPNPKIDHQSLIPIVRKSRGTRSYGTAALELAYVACGRIDAYITMRLSPWDFAAGYILIGEAGGTISTVSGESVNLLEKNSIFASKKGLHEEILSIIYEGAKSE